MAEKKVSGRRWNVIIDAVNRKIPKEKAGLNGEAEAKLYDEIKSEADALEKRGGVRPVFNMVEIESEDPALDIYNEPV